MDKFKTAREYYDSEYPDDKINYDYDDFIKKWKLAKKKLKQEHVYLVDIGWYEVWNFIDYAWADVKKYIENKYKIDDYLKSNFIFNTENRIESSLRFDGKLYLQYNLDDEGKKHVKKIFEEIFGDSFIFPKSDNFTIEIKLNPL